MLYTFILVLVDYFQIIYNYAVQEASLQVVKALRQIIKHMERIILSLQIK